MRVVEVGNLATALTGTYLSDLGWDVIVYRPPTDDVRLALCRGKRVVTDVSALHEPYDILVESVGCETCRTLGMSAPIHLGLPAYASGDEEHASFATDDAAIMAALGVFTDGLNRTLRGFRATYSHLPLPSVYGSIFGMCALMGAVVRGEPGYIEVPLATSLMEALVHNSTLYPVSDVYLNPRQRRLRSHKHPVTIDELDTLFDPFFTLYECHCGRHIYLVCPGHRRHQLDALSVLGVYNDVLTVAPIIDPYSPRGLLGIGSGSLSQDQASEVRNILTRAFMTRPAAEWEVSLGTARVPAVMVRTLEEWKTSSHVRDSGLFIDGRPAPLFWTHERNRIPPPPTRPLERIRVVDLANVIAGPSISAMLSRFGMDIIKVDPPDPLYSPEITVLYGLSTNVGKRSVILDVVRQREAFLSLLATADLLIVNTTDDGMRRLGLTEEQIRDQFPELIVTRFDAWGGPTEGGCQASWLGYDDNLQAASGIMARYGGGLSTPEEHAHVGTLDVISGVAGAAAALYALYKRQHGVVVEARTSLATVAQYIQYPFLITGEPVCFGGTGPLCRGLRPTYAIYHALDGSVLLTDTNDAVRWLGRVIDLQAFVGARTCGEVERVLSHPRLQVTRLRSTRELRERYTRDTPSKGTIQFTAISHPMGHVTTVVPNAMRGRYISTRPLIAPKYGQHSFEILRGNTASISRLAYCHNYIPQMPSCDACSETRYLFPIECHHKVCEACAMTSTRCPVCNADTLRQTRLTCFRRAYHNWRLGDSKGSITRTENVQTGTHRRMRSA